MDALSAQIFVHRASSNVTNAVGGRGGQGIMGTHGKVSNSVLAVEGQQLTYKLD